MKDRESVSAAILRELLSDREDTYTSTLMLVEMGLTMLKNSCGNRTGSRSVEINGSDAARSEGRTV